MRPPELQVPAELPATKPLGPPPDHLQPEQRVVKEQVMVPEAQKKRWAIIDKLRRRARRRERHEHEERRRSEDYREAMRRSYSAIAHFMLDIVTEKEPDPAVRQQRRAKIAKRFGVREVANIQAEHSNSAGRTFTK